MQLVFPSLIANGKLADVAKDWDIDLILENFPQTVLASLKAGGFNKVSDICSLGTELSEKLVLLKHIKEKTAGNICGVVDQVKEVTYAYLFDESVRNLGELVAKFDSYEENYVTVYQKTCCGKYSVISRVRIPTGQTTVLNINVDTGEPIGQLLVVLERECFAVFDTKQLQRQTPINQCFMVVNDTNPIEHTEEIIPLDERFSSGVKMTENTTSLLGKVQTGILNFFKKK